MLAIQSIVSILFLLFLFGVIEHIFGNKRGKLPRKEELGLDIVHALFNQVVTKWLVGVAVFAVAVAILTPLVIWGVRALDANGQFNGFGPVGSSPLWLQCVGALVLGDFLLYWICRCKTSRRCYATRSIVAKIRASICKLFR